MRRSTRPDRQTNKGANGLVKGENRQFRNPAAVMHEQPAQLSEVAKRLKTNRLESAAAARPPKIFHRADRNGKIKATQKADSHHDVCWQANNRTPVQKQFIHRTGPAGPPFPLMLHLAARRKASARRTVTQQMLSLLAAPKCVHGSAHRDNLAIGPA